MAHVNTSLSISAIRHPDYLYSSTLWAEWRDTFRGGEDYLQMYLKKFSDRETDTDFANRKACTPIPTFAKAAILDVRNSIFQRLEEISRIGGSKNYNKAVAGENAGVDRDGSSMNSFIGIDVLTELLVMGRVGVFVDAPSKVPTTLAEDARSPYLYHYRVEDILSYDLDHAAEDGTFKAVLLRDNAISYNTTFGDIKLPAGRETRFRLVWKDDVGRVWCRFYTKEEEVIRYPDSEAGGEMLLGVDVVPFVLMDIGDSLLSDVSSYQKALLNLVSGDVNWALKSNVPFLTIQQEMRTAGAHLKTTAQSATPGSQPAQNQEEKHGAGTGRYYDTGLDRPGYIAPPTDPLMASMKLQEKLEDDIRKLINLAVTNKSGSRTESAEAKKLSSQGLEAGLSFIGLVLQQGEQAIARYWGMYENIKKPEIAKVAYPSRYILKEDQERIDQAKSMLELSDRIPGTKAKKAIAKMVVAMLMSGKQSVDQISSILDEIEAAGYTTSFIDDVIAAKEAGLMGDELASEAIGVRKGEVAKAKKDHAEKLKLIQEAQTPVMPPGQGPALKNPASRGIPEQGVGDKTASEEQKDDDD